VKSFAVAGAPITWGVCEVPGWGHQLDPERVLAEMASLGLTATELGPDGFLPYDPTELRRVLERHRLRLVAGFVPVVLHDQARWEEERGEMDRQMATLAAGGAEMAVLAASSGVDGYEDAAALNEDEWGHLVAALAESSSVAASPGLGMSLHPHYGTVVERPDEIERVLAASPVDLCLDTGHVMVGGGDPVAVAEVAADRITHVHLKDVDAGTAERVRHGEITYHQAVVAGLYRPLGQGDVDLAAILTLLDGAGFDGWIVLEQDTVLSSEPPAGAGPVADAAESIRFLQRALEAV
jgi:inosose dehydratase